MSKKSQISDYMIAYIPRIIFLIVMLGSIYFLVHTFVKTEVDTFGVESSLFVDRMIYSKDGISAVSNGGVSPGIIDISSLATLEDSLKKSIAFSDSSHIAAKIVITDSGARELSTIYYNRDWFDRWIVLSNYPGSSGTKFIARKFYVLLKGRNELEKLQLRNQLVQLQMDGLAMSTLEATQLQKQMDDLAKKPKDDSLLPGFIEITVVMPNS